MKRTVAFIIIVIFSLSLFPPAVSAWDRDWNDPRYSSTDLDKTTEMDPWGETKVINPNNEYTIFNINLSFIVIDLYFNYFKSQPQIVIIKGNDSENNISEITIQDDNYEETADNKAGSRTPSGE